MNPGVHSAPWHQGSLLVKQPSDTLGVLNMLVGRKVTRAAVVPTVWQRLLALPEAKTADWSALRHVVYGASPIPLPVLRGATEVIGCSSRQSYGLTESTGGFTLLGPADHVPEEKFAHRLRSAGRPMTGARVRVVDLVTHGPPGGGARRGPGRRLSHHEGLLAQVPAVADVAAVGGMGRVPYAVVVLRPGAQVSEDELISWTRDRLAHFKCPIGVTFAPSLARTASGKLQKQAVRSSLGSLRVP